jgi:hypothetical protein
MINMTDKEQCPHCGKLYTRLTMHLLYCKEKPVEELEATESYVEEYVEYTTTEPIIEAQEQPCPYLAIIAGSSCSGCRGTSCTASKDKKISDEDYCRYEWPDCILYEEGIAAGVRQSCPYLSTVIPEGRTACCGLWCHARNKGVRVVRACRGWDVCGRFLEAKSDGKPFYRKKIT